MFRVFLLAVALLGCGDNLAPPIDAATEFIEALPGSGVMPQVIDSGGPILAAPIVQPIFSANAPDPDTEPYVEAFLPALSSSSYWTAVGAEYGIGPFTVMPSIISTDTVPTTDMAMATYLAGQLDGTHTGWPVADATSTIYMVMLPSGQTFAGACTEFGGYHSENTTNSADFVYAVIANCGAAPTLNATALDEVTSTISHEMIEAATDPKFSTAPAWESTDPEHLAWSREGGAELGDMCEWSANAQQRLVGSYLVQRIWSNAAALAGHDPCVPAPAGPYYNAAPTVGDILVATHSGTITTLGLTIPVGMSQQIDLKLFSDAPAPPWDITVLDGAALEQQPTSLSIEYGRTAAGSNGDTVSIVVRRDKPAMRGNLLFVENKPAGDDTQVPSYWWIFVQ